MNQKGHKKLLLIGSSKGAGHMLNFKALIEPYFDEILLVSGHQVDDQEAIKLNFSLKNPIRFILTLRALRKLIFTFQPDIIHVHQANSYGFMSALANRGYKPLVLTTWGSDVLLLPQKNQFYKWMVRFALKKANIITADAHFMAKAIDALAPEKEVQIANFGVEIQKLAEPIQKEKLIYSNRMHEPLYRIELIIEQSATFLKAHLDWKLRIAASGTQTASLKALAEKILPESSFEFVGFQAPAENRANYAKAQIYVSIPNSDGTAISLLEAMAYGCIPVVSDLQANKEWIKAQQNGLIYSGNLSADFENALQLDALSVAQINANLIEQQATKAVNQQKFFKLYDQLLNLPVSQNNKADQS
jgi:glycosyltransferase involved in cell wall biosynthesis